MGYLKTDRDLFSGKRIVIDISLPIPYLVKLFFSNYGPKCYWSIKLHDSLKCNNSRKKWMMKFSFGVQINMDVFYNLIVSLWVCVTKHVQITRSDKFTISLQYLKINVKAEALFLPADKHQMFLQIYTIIFIVKVSYKLILSFLVWKFPTNWYYDFCWGWSSIAKVPKIEKDENKILHV